MLMYEEEQKIHSYVVCVEYEVYASSIEEAEMCYSDGLATVVDICDLGEI